jgi:hypothetical protein
MDRQTASSDLPNVGERIYDDAAGGRCRIQTPEIKLVKPMLSFRRAWRPFDTKMETWAYAVKR